MSNFICHFIDNDKQLHEAFGVRRKVFIEEQNIPEEIEMDELDGEALHVTLSERERIVATARVRFPEPGTAKIERMAVLKEYRRRGVGSILLDFIEEELRNRQVSEAVLHAQWEVKDFYRSCGFTETGEPFTEAGIKHIEMRKNL